MSLKLIEFCASKKSDSIIKGLVNSIYPECVHHSVIRDSVERNLKLRSSSISLPNIMYFASTFARFQ